jgi:hypothetical protein
MVQFLLGGGRWAPSSQIWGAEHSPPTPGSYATGLNVLNPTVLCFHQQGFIGGLVQWYNEETCLTEECHLQKMWRTGWQTGRITVFRLKFVTCCFNQKHSKCNFFICQVQFFPSDLGSSWEMPTVSGDWYRDQSTSDISGNGTTNSEHMSRLSWRGWKNQRWVWLVGECHEL